MTAPDIAPPAYTIVLIHGAWGTPSTLLPLADVLREHGQSVYVASTPGMSSNPDREPYSSAEIAADIARQVRRNVPHGGVVLVGHSFGGFGVTGVAALLAKTRTHQVIRRVYISAFVPEPNETMLGIIEATDPQVAAMFRAAAEASGDDTIRFDRETFGQIVTPGDSDEVADMVWRETVPQHIEAFDSPLRHADDADAAPGSYVHLVEDHATDWDAQAQRLGPDRIDVVVPGANHGAVVTMPVEVGAAVRTAIGVVVE